VVAGSLLGFLGLHAAAATHQRTHWRPATPSSTLFIGLMLGVSLGGEVVSHAEWGAAGIVTAGVVLILWGRRARTAHADR
jgi:drug/metabolite transporter (DMT)-like permease